MKETEKLTHMEIDPDIKKIVDEVTGEQKNEEEINYMEPEDEDCPIIDRDPEPVPDMVNPNDIEYNSLSNKIITVLIGILVGAFIIAGITSMF